MSTLDIVAPLGIGALLEGAACVALGCGTRPLDVDVGTAEALALGAAEAVGVALADASEDADGCEEKTSLGPGDAAAVSPADVSIEGARAAEPPPSGIAPVATAPPSAPTSAMTPPAASSATPEVFRGESGVELGIAAATPMPRGGGRLPPTATISTTGV